MKTTDSLRSVEDPRLVARLCDGAFRVGRLSRLRPTRDELHCLRNVDHMSLNAPGF
ncbi:MAG: hypothetical protein M3076_19315 [Actinomycetota bacterium]|nr:hypothetical protein [Actinomycetota bacterium]